MTSSISQKTQGTGCLEFFQRPYLEAGKHFNSAFSGKTEKGLSLMNRVSQVTLGVLLLVPVINHIVLALLKPSPSHSATTNPRPTSTSSTKPSDNRPTTRPLQPPIISSPPTVKDTAWLDSLQLHYYSEFLQKTYPIHLPKNSKFFTISPIVRSLWTDVQKMTSKQRQKNIKEYMPFFLHLANNHWALVFIDRKLRTVEYYDSLLNYGNHEEIKTELQRIAGELTQQDPGSSPYQFQCKLRKKVQQDGYQCGVWLLYFLENRLKNPQVDFNTLDVNSSQAMIAEFRRHIFQHIPC